VGRGAGQPVPPPTLMVRKNEENPGSIPNRMGRLSGTQIRQLNAHGTIESLGARLLGEQDIIQKRLWDLGQ
jgi:hypothetical protein